MPETVVSLYKMNFADVRLNILMFPFNSGGAEAVRTVCVLLIDHLNGTVCGSDTLHLQDPSSMGPVSSILKILKMSFTQSVNMDTPPTSTVTFLLRSIPEVSYFQLAWVTSDGVVFVLL